MLIIIIRYTLILSTVKFSLLSLSLSLSLNNNLYNILYVSIILYVYNINQKFLKKERKYHKFVKDSFAQNTYAAHVCGMWYLIFSTLKKEKERKVS